MAGTMEGLGRKLWDDAEMQAFARSENSRNYQDYKNMLEKDYDKNYSLGGNFLGWLGNGLSGGGWSKDDFLKNRGIDKETDEYGNAGYVNTNDIRNYSSAYNKNRLEQLDAGKGLFSGVPILGDILSAPAQTLSAGKDLVESGTSKWENGKRDWLSDLGAAGETAIDIATLGAGGAGIAGAKTGLASTIGKGALLGAGYGLTGSLNEMGSKNFDIGQLLTGTGLGAAVGGGIAGIGGGISKAWNKYSAGVPSNSTELVRYAGGNAANTPAYQNALNTLGLSGDNLTSDVVNKARKDAMKNVASTVGYESAEGQAQRQAINNSYQTLQDVLNGSSNGAQAQYVAPSLSLGEKWKNFGRNIPNMGRDLKNTKVGTKVSSLLGTKAGKIGAGVGGGLLLAKLMNGGGNNQDTGLSDEELMQLYNYYGGGY